MPKLLKFLVAALLLAAIGLVVFLFVSSKPEPEGTEGPEADAIARKLEAAVDVAAWNDIGVVAWTFGGRRRHIWDRTRGYAHITWADVEATIDLDNPENAEIRREGQIVSGDDKAELHEEAHKAWINDSFWLNPLAKLFDEGVHRAVVELDGGGKGLLIGYESGGVTPGDKYLWLLGDDGLPTAWRMWVGIVPVGGLEVSWDRWEKLPGGALVSTLHEGPLTLELTDIRAGAVVADVMKGEDPFAALVGKAGPSSQPASGPASAPAPTETETATASAALPAPKTQAAPAEAAAEEL